MAWWAWSSFCLCLRLAVPSCQRLAPATAAPSGLAFLLLLARNLLGNHLYYLTNGTNTWEWVSEQCRSVPVWSLDTYRLGFVPKNTASPKKIKKQKIFCRNPFLRFESESSWKWVLSKFSSQFLLRQNWVISSFRGETEKYLSLVSSGTCTALCVCVSVCVYFVPALDDS